MQPVEYSNVTIEVIDQAIYDWLDRTVDAHVEHPNGERRKVPVVFASGERFATGRTRKGVRDRNGVLILPIISLKRTNVSPDPSMQALGTETPTMQLAKRISPKTNALRNANKLRDSALSMVPAPPVVYEVTTIPFPDRSIMDYEIVVQTQYITQMNSVLEKLVNQLDLQKSFVAPFENDDRHPDSGEPFETRVPLKKGYVVGFMDSDMADTGNFEEFTDHERIVQWKIPIRVPATLQLDPEGEKPAVQKEYTSFGLGFGKEKETFFDDPAEFDKIFGR